MKVLGGMVNMPRYMTASQVSEYYTFCAYVNRNQPRVTSAGLGTWLKSVTPKWIGDRLDFIKELAASLKVDFDELLKLFKNSAVYKFFSEFKFSIDKLKATFKKAINLMDDLLSDLSKFISSLGGVKKLNNAKDDIILKIDEFLRKHPAVKSLGNVFLASILLYITLNGASLGSMADFDVSQILDALIGKLTFLDVFGGDNGVKLLLSLALGMSGVSLSYSLLNNARFIPSMIKWFAVQVKDKDLAKEIKIR